jgi:murein DD-endopeptidase MepM/ murein hydrolase activator NlpD
VRFAWPLVDHIVTRGFDYKADLYVGGQHAAIDLIARTIPTRNAPITAAADGTVVDNRWDFYSGNLVSVSHDGGWSSHYRHLIRPSPVAVGQRVTQGQVIGNAGNTGVSQGDHLHFDLWCATKHDSTAFAKRGLWAHDPALYLGKEEDDMAALEELKARVDGLEARTARLETFRLNALARLRRQHGRLTRHGERLARHYKRLNTLAEGHVRQHRRIKALEDAG